MDLAIHYQLCDLKYKKRTNNNKSKNVNEVKM